MSSVSDESYAAERENGQNSDDSDDRRSSDKEEAVEELEPSETAEFPAPQGAKRKRRTYKQLPADELFVDWGRLASTEFGQDKLTRYLSGPEIDELVGWATHQTSARCPPENSSRNPLVGLPNQPLRPSILKALIKDPASEGARDNSALYERFDTSAAVAIGMLLEEMLTTTMLPLAEQHVMRCRQLEECLPEDEKYDDLRLCTTSQDIERRCQIKRARQDVFEQWTLPPDEAISRLMTESDHVARNSDVAVRGLITALPPQLSVVPGAIGTSRLSVPRPGQRERMALETWCTSQRLDVSFVRNNADFFQFLVPMNIISNPSVRDSVPIRSVASDKTTES